MMSMRVVKDNANAGYCRKVAVEAVVHHSTLYTEKDFVVERRVF